MIARRPLAPPGLASSEVLREAFHGPWRVWAFNGALALACVFVWVFDVRHFDVAPVLPHPHLAWWALALAFYLAEVFVVHLQFRKQAHTLSLTEIGLVLGLLLAS
ncbi:MAG TPA: hypothetical protein VGP54_02295, partial [Gaiellaceae bacterium]|nr:hypothetical protein [Gaiellaceae bacterium]